MTPEEEAAIRERHAPDYPPAYKAYEGPCCNHERVLWPCDTAIVLAALDTSRKAADAFRDALAIRMKEPSGDHLEAVHAMVAARADADRLAVELRQAHRSLEEFNGGRGTMFPGAYSLDHAAGTYENCQFCDALAAHEALKPPKKAVAYTNVTNDDWVMADADETQEP